MAKFQRSLAAFFYGAFREHISLPASGIIDPRIGWLGPAGGVLSSVKSGTRFGSASVAWRRPGFLFPAFLTPLIALTLAGCYPPPQEPWADNAGGIGISFQTEWAKVPWLADSPEIVLFAQVEEGNPLLRQKKILQSNFRRGEMVYLLNAPPGRYMAVAFSHVYSAQRVPRGLNTFGGFDDFEVTATYLPGDLIAKTEVEVRPNEFVVMGRFKVRKFVELQNEDETQRYYYKLIRPDIKNHEGNSISDPENYHSATGKTLAVDQGKETRRALFNQALEDLKGSGWAPLVQRRLDALAQE